MGIRVTDMLAVTQTHSFVPIAQIKEEEFNLARARFNAKRYMGEMEMCLYAAEKAKTTGDYPLYTKMMERYRHSKDHVKFYLSQCKRFARILKELEDINKTFKYWNQTAEDWVPFSNPRPVREQTYYHIGGAESRVLVLGKSSDRLVGAHQREHHLGWQV